MTATFTRNGWGSLYPDPEYKTVLSSSDGQRVRSDATKEWVGVNHFDPSVEGAEHMVTLRHGKLAWVGFGATQAAAWVEARRKAEDDGYEAPK